MGIFKSCNLEIGTQSQDSENAQCNLEIAQILRLCGMGIFKSCNKNVATKI